MSEDDLKSEVQKMMRQAEAQLGEVLKILKGKTIRELPTADASQLESVAKEVWEKAHGLYISRVFKRLNKAEAENRDLKAMIAHDQKKADHGCTDAYCPICDGGTL